MSEKEKNSENLNVSEDVNTEASVNDSKKEKKGKSSKKGNIGQTIIIVALLIIIVLLLLRSFGPGNDGGGSKPDDGGSIGNFEVSGTQREREPKIRPEGVTPTIKFSGYGKCTVSADQPNIELKNPEDNYVDFVFTVSDKESGDIIARTPKVYPGNFVYVNVMDYYKSPGVYNVTINISTYSTEDGAQKNGMNQELKLTVE